MIIEVLRPNDRLSSAMRLLRIEAVLKGYIIGSREIGIKHNITPIQQ
jgi:hypothetical protein